MSFREFEEEARVEKADGRILGPFKAIFAGDTIVIDDGKADIEEGDTVLRRLPNGRDERSLVTKANFFRQGVGSIGPHYQLRFRRGGESAPQKPTHQITISSAHSVQIGDYNTQNIVSSFEALVQAIDTADAGAPEKEEAKSRLRSFLEHPVVVSLLGAAAGRVIG